MTGENLHVLLLTKVLRVEVEVKVIRVRVRESTISQSEHHDTFLLILRQKVR